MFYKYTKLAVLLADEQNKVACMFLKLCDFIQLELFSGSCQTISVKSNLDCFFKRGKNS